MNAYSKYCTNCSYKKTTPGFGDPHECATCQVNMQYPKTILCDECGKAITKNNKKNLTESTCDACIPEKYLKFLKKVD